MKIKGKQLNNAGLRLKPREKNILENYTKYKKTFPSKRKKKKKRSKRKNVIIKDKFDLMQKLIDDSSKTKLVSPSLEIKDKFKEQSKENKDNSQTDKDIKKLFIKNIQLDKDKKSSGIIIQ